MSTFWQSFSMWFKYCRISIVLQCSLFVDFMSRTYPLKCLNMTQSFNILHMWHETDSQGTPYKCQWYLFINIATPPPPSPIKMIFTVELIKWTEILCNCSEVEFYCFMLNFTGPFFEVFQLKVKVYTSRTYEEIKKGQDKFTMSTEQSVPLCGDIKVVFYNKPRLTKKKVSYLFILQIYFSISRLYFVD